MAPTVHHATAVILCGAVLSTATAWAGIRRHDVPDLSYTNLALDPLYDAAVRVSTPSGSCSGVFVAPDAVLTAGHCVISRQSSDEPNPGDLVDNREGNFTIFDVDGNAYTSRSVDVHPTWLTNIRPSVQNDPSAGANAGRQGFDLALIHLNWATDIQPAIRALNVSSLQRTVTIVGYGATATGNTTGDNSPGGTRRAGRNVVEDTEGPNGNQILIDLDHPTQPQVSTLGGTSPLSLEYIAAPGDSGGPWYASINGVNKLVGISSFGRDSNSANRNFRYGDQSGAANLPLAADWLYENLRGVHWRSAIGAYDVTTNWTTGQMPGEDDIVTFAMDGGSTVIFYDDVTTAWWVRIQYGNVEFANLGKYEIDSHLDIDEWGHLMLAEGHVSVGSNISLGVTDTYGAITVSDEGRLTAGGQIRVYERGSLTIEDGEITASNIDVNGGAFFHEGGQINVGQLLPIDGISVAGKLTFRNDAVATTGNMQLGGSYVNPIGQFIPSAPGELIVENGAELNTTGTVFIGGANGVNVSPGSATVDNALWNVEGAVVLGVRFPNDIPKLIVTKSGQVEATVVQVYNAGRIEVSSGRLTVQGLFAPGSSLIHTGGEIVLDGGPTTINGGFATGGLFRLTNGATATTNDFQVGRGYIPISTNPPIYLADNGALRLEAGATMTTNGNAKIGSGPFFATPAGSFVDIATIDNATWNVSGAVNIDGFLSNQAILAVQNSGKLTANSINVLNPFGQFVLTSGRVSAQSISAMAGGPFTMTGGELTVKDFHGNLTQQGGTLMPGSPIGTSTIHGTHSLTANSAIQLDIRGTQPATAYDRILVDGIAAIAGELRVNFLDGFTPLATDIFSVLISAGISGNFSNVLNGQRLSTLDGSGSLLVHYGAGSIFDATQVVLSQYLAQIDLPGDYNLDGTVDAADYIVWRNGFGTTYTEGDYNVWRANFGSTSPGTGSGALAAVPEPSALVLACVAIAFASRMAAVLKTQRQ